MSEREMNGEDGQVPSGNGVDLDGLLAELPRSLPPDRDLLPGIRARIAAEGGGSGGGRRAGAEPSRGFERRRWLAAAAILLVALGAGLWAQRGAGPELGSEADGTRDGASAVRNVVAPEAAAAWSRLEIRYAEAVDDLLTELARGASGLSPERRAAIRRNLEAIDRALAEIGAALAADPDDPALLRGAERTWQWKLDFLRQAMQATARSQA